MRSVSIVALDSERDEMKALVEKIKADQAKVAALADKIARHNQEESDGGTNSS